MKTVEEIWKLPAFQSFLLAKPFLQLAVVAKNSPVAILIASHHGCDALLIRHGSTSPQHIPLDEINYEGGIQLSKRRAKALALSNVQIHRGPSDHQAQECNPNVLEYEIQQILADIWDQVVEPVLD